MKVFTVTPEEFANGTMSRMAALVLHPPRPKRPRVAPLERQPLKMGTITPEQFASGEPWVGYRDRRKRHAALPGILKPLPEALRLVHLLLDADDSEEWYGVDLDGTLARYTGWKGLTHIGKPIPRMVQRVRRWVSHGKKVKIFTARADDEKSVNAIKKWLKDNDLPDLPITNLKDQHCVKFYDDRAVHVERNTGRIRQ